MGYFHKNKDSGGIVDTGVLGNAFEKIIGKTKSKRKNSHRKKGQKKQRRLYTIMSDGIVFKMIDKGNEYTVLRANDYDSKFLGVSKIRNSTRLQKFRKVNWRCSLIYHSFRKYFMDLDIDVDRCIIIEGCYNSNLHTLQRTMDPEFKGKFSQYPTGKNIRMFEHAIRVMFNKTKMYGMLETPTFSDVYLTNISTKKKPGYRYEECFFMQTKGEALNDAFEIAKKRWEYLDNVKPQNVQREEMYTGVYTIGARNKRDFTYEDEELTVSRAVHMPELHVELTSAPWCDFFIERIKELKKGPIYIGNSILEWERLKKDCEDSEYILEGDFRRFDSTLYIIAITCAVAFMRSFFDHDSESIDSHFIGMYDSLSIKDYYVVGGKVFRMYHGLPSGVKSTSLLGSIINLLSLIYCVDGERLQSFNFIIGGDDFLIVCNKGCSKRDVLITKVQERIIKLGMKFKFLDIKFYNSLNIFDCPTFYKYTIYKNKPVTPPNAAMERILMPWNKKYNTDEKLFTFLKDVMPSLGTPMSHLYIYYRFYQYMFAVVTKRHIEIKEIFKLHNHQFYKMLLNKDSSKLHKYKKDEVDSEQSTVSYNLVCGRNKIKKIKFDPRIF